MHIVHKLNTSNRTSMNPTPKFSKVHIINTLVLLNKVVQNSRTFHSLLPLISYHHEKTMTFHVTSGLYVPFYI